jgi:hypothetical protein
MHVVAKDRDSPLVRDTGPGLSPLMRKGILVNLVNEPTTERIGNPKPYPMIRSVTGAHNRASPVSICIPLIRLKKPALASIPTPEGRAKVLRRLCQRTMNPSERGQPMARFY